MAVKRYLLLKSELTAKDIVPFSDTTKKQPSARSIRKQRMKAAATATATDPETWTQVRPPGPKARAPSLSLPLHLPCK